MLKVLMTDHECETAFEQLESAMTNAGLRWVTTEVNEEIRFGRTVTKRVSSRPDTPEDVANEGLTDKRRKSKVTIAATRPYTAQEKLRALLDSLEDVIVETQEMQKAVKQYVTSHAKNWRELRLVRTDAAGRDPVIISPTTDEERTRAVAHLQTLIVALKGVVSDGNPA
jgi:tRNA A37 methylthiotransferase MiaB